MQRTKTAEPPGRCAIHGRHAPLSAATITRAVGMVLAGERRRAACSLTFVGKDRMRALNRRWKGADRPTDVLAFAMVSPGAPLLGDIYICRAVAKREAGHRDIPLRQELLRLVVHGVLHILGHDHPEGEERVASAMWRRQERYLRRLR